MVTKLKNAYHGGIIRYPHKDYVMPDGTVYSAREMAREQSERLKTGGIIVFPNSRDERGQYQWSWEEPKILGNASEIREYPRDLDLEILRGLGIPDNVLTDSPGTGSYAGRRVPERAFYVSLEELVSEILSAIKAQIIDPLLKLNFEGHQEYEIITKPLVEVMAPEGSPGPGGPGMPGTGNVGVNTSTIGGIFSSEAAPDDGMGLSSGSPATGVARMSIRTMDYLEQESINVGYFSLDYAIRDVQRLNNLPKSTINNLYNSNSHTLRKLSTRDIAKISGAGYNSPREAWMTVQRVASMPKKVAKALLCMNS